MENRHALLLADSVVEAARQATIEMRDSKYLKEEEDGEKDDAEAEQDQAIFRKRTYKGDKQKTGGSGGSGNKSFARKRKRV